MADQWFFNETWNSKIKLAFFLYIYSLPAPYFIYTYQLKIEYFIWNEYMLKSAYLPSLVTKGFWIRIHLVYISAFHDHFYKLIEAKWGT